MSNLVLVVDDEEDLLQIIDYNLQREGYSTRSALTGAQAIELAQREPVPDLVLLDLMLPDISGFEVCAKLRAMERTEHVPVIMLTAKGGEIDRVVGFEVGADDYVVKPFNVRELMLRIRAVLRRSRAEPGEEVEQFLHGCLRVDVPAHQVSVDERAVELTALEFNLLTTLLRRQGRVQTRDVLLGDVWGIPGDITTRTVDTHVKRLRQKLGAAGDYIETVRGVGYRFRAEPRRAAS